MREIEQILKNMTGTRERCMYCEDSRGTDIEHFWPKKVYRERVFQWPNLLWACAGCNRSKGDRFPRDVAGSPLLIDPTQDDPWDYLFYDSETDEITARWDCETQQEYAKALYTLKILSTLRLQAVTEGRKRIRRNLTRAVRAFLNRSEDVGSEDATQELIESIRDNDDYGLVIWFFLLEGQDEAPFRELRQNHREVWEQVLAVLF